MLAGMLLVLAGLTPSRASAASVHVRCATIEALRAIDGEHAESARSRVFVSLNTTNCAVTSVSLRVRLPDGSSTLLTTGAMSRRSGRIWLLRSGAGMNDVSIHGKVQDTRGTPAVQLVIAAPRKSTPSHATSTAIVAIFGVLGTVGAAVLVERSTRGRERRARQDAWNAMLFARYEPPLLEFLSTWRGTTDADMLRTTYTRLETKAVVPPAIATMYAATQATLADDAVSQDEKLRAAEQFQGAIKQVLRSPGGLTTPS